MFKVMDKYRTAAQILLGAVGISFVGFGLAGFQGGADNNYILRVGDEAITRYRLEQAIRNTEAAGGQADREAVFQTLVSQAYLSEGARQMGVAVSDEQIKNLIVNTPLFQNADKKFDPTLFQNYLQSNHITEQQFMDARRAELLTAGLIAALNGGAVSDVQAAAIWNATLAPRDIRMMSVNPAAFAAQVKVSEGELKKFYEANKKNYTLPQAAKFEYVRLTPQDLAAKQSASEAEIAQALKERPAAQAKRRIAHILIEAPAGDAAAKAKAKAQAEKIAAEAKAAPAKFGELAKKHSQDPASAEQGGDLGEVSQDGLPDKALAESAFALKAGEVSGAVESKYGYHVLYVKEAAADNAAAAKAEAEQSVKAKKAQQAYAKLREELGELTFTEPKSLKPAADKLGLTVQAQTEWVGKDNAAALKIPAAVAEALFSDEVFNKKHNSEVLSADGASWVVRVTETRAASTEPFEKVKAKVEEDFVRSESLRLAQEAAKKTLAALQAGKAADGEWSGVQQVVPAEARVVLPPQVFAAFMKAVPKDGKPAYALLDGVGMPEIWEVRDIKTDSNPQALAMAREYLAQMQGNALLEAYIDSLRASVKTKQGAERVSDGE